MSALGIWRKARILQCLLSHRSTMVVKGQVVKNLRNRQIRNHECYVGMHLLPAGVFCLGKRILSFQWFVVSVYAQEGSL
jgi:hypothetical protein